MPKTAKQYQLAPVGVRSGPVNLVVSCSPVRLGGTLLSNASVFIAKSSVNNTGLECRPLPNSLVSAMALRAVRRSEKRCGAAF